MQVSSVNLGTARPHPGAPGKLTGIYKQPAPELVVLPLRVDGDAVCDTRYHGDPSKAICVYCGDHYAHWHDAYPAGDWSPGAFGENLTVSGWHEDTAHLGDVVQVGECLLQVSQPRQPCGTLAARHGIRDFAKVAVDAGRTGWYVRVLRPGAIRPGDAIVLVEADPHGVSIANANAVKYATTKSRSALARVLAVGAMSESWRESLGEAWERAET